MVNAGPGPSVSIRIARTCALILCCGLLCRGDPPDILKTRSDFLLRQLSGEEILAGGRLTDMPHPTARSESRSIAHLDGILSSTNANSSIRHRRILSLVYLLGGHLDKEEQELGQLALELPNDAGMQNDPGVVQIGLAVSDPNAWITALRHFEAAL